MQIKFKKLTPEAVAPKQGTTGSAGFDLTAVTMHFDWQEGLCEYGTGIAVEIPPGYVGLCFPRSSVYRKNIILSNCVGVIDSDYRGEIKAKFYTKNRSSTYDVGDRIIQLVIVPIPEVDFVESDELSSTDRGTGGYGSTGK